MDDMRVYASEEYVKTHKRECVIVSDIITGIEYMLTIKNGTLVSTMECSYIEITKLPNKTTYMAGEQVDLDGLEITAVCKDGGRFIVDTYKCNKYATSDFLIVYNNCNVDHYVYLSLDILPFDPESVLVDFDYIVEKDGTYTITDWKGTLNGEPSTELVVPANALINVYL